MNAAMRVSHPRSVAEAVGILAAEPSARCIAGGGTLVAMMNASLAEDIAHLVDLKGIDGLRGIERSTDGTVRIGAMTKHAETSHSAALIDGQSVLSEAASRTANRVVRNMGTIGGSVAFADPAADYLPALRVLDASVEISNAAGSRLVPIADYCLDWYQTALEPGDLVTAIVVPPAPLGTVGHYRKFTRTGGDYAIAGIAVILRFEAGRVAEIRCSVGACGPFPVRLAAAEDLLTGSALEPDLVHQAGLLLTAACDPVDDARASAEYRRILVPRLLASALAEAQRRAVELS
jgi:carbon-monoxide dehydrogenase medium subunit